MSENDPTPNPTPNPAPRKGGQPDKRRSIIAGALTVFARDGYARASIDTIATEAGVSTRTIYNHFDGKAELFETVIRQSTSSVADTQIAIIDRHLHTIVDLPTDLERLGVDLATPMTGYAEHFALIRHVEADLDHIPGPAIDTWQQAGPHRVIGQLSARMRELGDNGWLRVEDPELAAVHFMSLTQAAIPFHHGTRATPPDRVREVVVAGVRAFLYGYHA